MATYVPILVLMTLAALVAMAERAYLWPIGLVANEDATWTFAFASIGDSVDELDAVARRVAGVTE